MDGALENLQLAHRFYPSWECRFYVSQEIPEALVDALRKEGATVIRKTRRSKSDGMFWRFRAANEKDLDAVIVRDLDSRLSEREALAVGEWIESGKAYHIIRDHPAHRALIMGGMWGVRGNVLPNMRFLLLKWYLLNIDLAFTRKGFFGANDRDQHFLNQIVYPLIKNDVLIHSEFCRFEGEHVQPFPSARENGGFVGQVVDDSGTLLDSIRESRCLGKSTSLSVPHDYRLVPRTKRRARTMTRLIAESLRGGRA